MHANVSVRAELSSQLSVQFLYGIHVPIISTKLSRYRYIVAGDRNHFIRDPKRGTLSTGIAIFAPGSMTLEHWKKTRQTKTGKGYANCACITHAPFVYVSYQLEE